MFGFHFSHSITHMLHGAGIFTNIYPINDPHVAKYTSTMGCIWIADWWFGTFFIFPFSWECHHPN